MANKYDEKFKNLSKKDKETLRETINAMGMGKPPKNTTNKKQAN